MSKIEIDICFIKGIGFLIYKFVKVEICFILLKNEVILEIINYFMGYFEINIIFSI